MSVKPESVGHFYNNLGTAEQRIKEGKYALHWTPLSCKGFVSNQVRLGLFVLPYNLGNFLRRLVLPRKIKHWPLRSLLVKLINVGATVIRHNRYTTVQMAAVAINQTLVAEILTRMKRLRYCYVCIITVQSKTQGRSCCNLWRWAPALMASAVCIYRLGGLKTTRGRGTNVPPTCG